MKIISACRKYSAAIRTAVSEMKHKTFFIILLTLHNSAVMPSLLVILVVIVTNSFPSTFSTPRGIARLYRWPRRKLKKEFTCSAFSTLLRLHSVSLSKPYGSYTSSHCSPIKPCIGRCWGRTGVLIPRHRSLRQRIHLV